MLKKYNIGNLVKKNPDNWIVNDFDRWGRGLGIGEVVEPPFTLNENEVDVVWPAGRCFESIDQLLPASDEDIEAHKRNKE